MNNLLKYIEIRSIEQVDDKYYLQIALHANEVKEVYWQIDEVTYENLYLQCDFSGSDRYRLSFKILENPSINKLVGRITRTYLMSSSMIDFQTTKEFKKQLQLIKMHCQANTLHQLAFIEHNIHGFEEEEPVIDEKPNTEASIPVEVVGEIPSTDLNVPQASDTVVQNEAPTETLAPDEIAVEQDEIKNGQAVEEEQPTENVVKQNNVNTVGDGPTEDVTKQNDVNTEEDKPSELAEKATEPVEREAINKDEEVTELFHDLVEQPELLATQELAEKATEDTTAKQEPVAITTLAEEQENSTVDAEIPPQPNTSKEAQNQATTLAKLVEENNLKREHEKQNEVVATLNGKEQVASIPSQPIQTLLTLPAFKPGLPNTTISQSSLEEVVEPVVETIEVANKVQEVEIEAQLEQNSEKSNIAAEEEKVTATQMLAPETTAPAELVEPVTELAEQPIEEPKPTKPVIAEKEEEGTPHISNNMIALLAIAVAIFVAVAIYFIFFQQNVNTLNTESAIVSETTNAVTYDIEESFTFSLPKEYVALTFNRGPSAYTEEILNLLKEYNYGATFFLQGNQVPLYPDIVKTVDLNGHAIGHITNSHTLLTILEIEDQREALTKPKEAIEQLINKEVVLVRPPFNTFNKNTISIQQEYDLKIVNSSIALKSGDNVTAAQIIKAFEKEALDGAIIGLDESQATVEALPTLLEKIKQSGLQIVILK